MSHPPVVSGEVLRPLFEALNVRADRVREIWIHDWRSSDGVSSVEVTYANLGPNGEKYRVGDTVATVTVRAYIEWSADEESAVFGTGDQIVEMG